MAGLRLDDATIAGVVAALGSTQRPTAIDRARVERQMRDLALEHVAGAIADATYRTCLGELRAQIAALDASPGVGVPAAQALAWLRAIGDTWVHAEVHAEKADLLHVIYDRIIVAGREIVSVRLTPAAYGHGLAVALPEVVRARLTGVGRALATYDMPIEGRDEWLAAARRLA